MEPKTLFKIVGAVALGLLGYLFIGFFSGIGGAVIGYVAGPPLINRWLHRY